MDHLNASDRDEQRQRLRPTAEGRAQLLAAVEALGPTHAVDAGALGEYAEIVVNRGRPEADAQMPDVAAHIAGGCAACADDLAELLTMLAAADPEPIASPGALDSEATPLPSTVDPLITPSPLTTPHPPTPSPAQGRGGEGSGERPDSGVYAGELRDPRFDEREAARRQRLHRIRLWLVVAAAISVALIGLSLIGLAYLSSGQAAPARLLLTPARSSPGRSAPTGVSCPASHPIKGNRPSMIYHAPGGAFYDQTGPEDCFATAADAEAAGYRPSQR